METKNSILVVDDDASNLMVLNHILREDYLLYMDKDGRSALKKAKEFMPDLIILDIIMPNMKISGIINRVPLFTLFFINSLLSARSFLGS